MSKKRYEIDDRKPSLLPKIGTAVVAIGSLASAAAMAAPSITDFSTLMQSNNTSPAPTISKTSQPDATLPSKQIAVQPEAETTATGQNSNQLAQEASIVVVESPAAVDQATATPAPAATEEPTATPAPTATEQPAQQSALQPIGSSAGNISSPTPSGSNATWGGSEAASAPVGNASSPTPSGVYYEDDDDDDKYDNRHDDDHDDDRHDDDHDDDDHGWWDFGHDDEDDD